MSGTKSNKTSINSTVKPQTTVDPETTVSAGTEPEINNDFGPELDSKSEEFDFNDRDGSGFGKWLRDIERDGLVSMEATRNTGLALMLGSAIYINDQSKDIDEAVKDSIPEEAEPVLEEIAESIPEDLQLDEYVPEQIDEFAEEAAEYMDEQGIEFPDGEEITGYLESEESPIDPEDLDISNYESELEQVLEENEPLIDETIRKLNTNVTSWEEMGIDPSKGLGQLDAETVTDAILYSFDNFTHLAVTGTASNFATQAADRYTDRDAVKVAAGMSVALFYHVAKEGFYEGGAGLQFDYDNLDVQGDVMSDFLGALWGTSSYMLNRGKEQAKEGERETGLSGSAAHKIGRAYEKSKYLAQTNVPTRMFQYETGDEFPTELDLENMDDIAEREYETDQTAENQVYAD